MEITWKLSKKRGNFRPVLNYKIIIGSDEKDLGIPSLSVDTKILKPIDSWESHCFPNNNERGGLYDKETYKITTPSFKKPEVKGRLMLAWRETLDYRDVEKGMELVRNEIEKEVLNAQKSLPIEKSGSIEYTSDFRKKAAPAIAAERFLKAAM